MFSEVLSNMLNLLRNKYYGLVSLVLGWENLMKYGWIFKKT